MIISHGERQLYIKYTAILSFYHAEALDYYNEQRYYYNPLRQVADL